MFEQFNLTNISPNKTKLKEKIVKKKHQGRGVKPRQIQLVDWSGATPMDPLPSYMRRNTLPPRYPPPPMDP